MKRRFRIDKEFESLIAPLFISEYAHLKQNILSDGCREPIAIWNGVIVDGHNRYKICTVNNVPAGYTLTVGPGGGFKENYAFYKDGRSIELEKVKAKKKGTCYISVTALNGVRTKIKITVK